MSTKDLGVTMDNGLVFDKHVAVGWSLPILDQT